MATNILGITVGRGTGSQVGYSGSTITFFGGSYGSKVNDADDDVGSINLSTGGTIYLFIKNVGTTPIRVDRITSQTDTTVVQTVTLNRQGSIRGHEYFVIRSQDIPSLSSAFFRNSDIGNKVYLAFTQGGSPLNLFEDFAPPPRAELEDWIDVYLGTLPLKQIYQGGHLYWDTADSASNLPQVTSFRSSLSTIDLDTRPTGNITLTFAVSGSTRNTIYDLNTNRAVALTSNTTAVIAQPRVTTTYRIVAQNSHGANHLDVTVTVTQNPAISNLRRTRFLQIPRGGGSVLYEFSGNVVGLPTPTLRYSFSTGETGVIQAPVNGVFSFRHTFAGVVAGRRLTVTARNASGSTSRSINA